MMVTADKRIGVFVMSYGTPASMAQIEEYYTHIRRGRPPSPEQLQDLVSRYEAIVGGFFPLRKHTDNQVEALERRLNELAQKDVGRTSNTQPVYVCYQGLKHARPYIEDGIKQMAAEGITDAIGIVLAPHYSSLSVGTYIERAREQAEALHINIRFVESYHLHPLLLEALSSRVTSTLQRFSGVPIEQIKVLFSAHSLPQSIVAQGDPYPEQLLETSRAIVARTGVVRWAFAWQSAGNTPVPWLGPDITDALREIAAQGEVKYVLVCPIGFVSDHLEVLYDIDIECQAVCDEHGLQLLRTPSLNSDPLFIDTLAQSVRGESVHV